MTIFGFIITLVFGFLGGSIITRSLFKEIDHLEGYREGMAHAYEDVNEILGITRK